MFNKIFKNKYINIININLIIIYYIYIKFNFIMSKYELIIDNREKYLIKALDNLNTKYKKENLELGDIVFKYDNKIALLIERKTLDDLSASIRDGRYKEQKVRLLNTNINKINIMYLIEGNFNNKSKINGMSSDSLLGSIANTMFRDNIRVYMTNNLTETCNLLLKINKNLPNYINNLIINNNFNNNSDNSNNN